MNNPLFVTDAERRMIPPSGVRGPVPTEVPAPEPGPVAAADPAFGPTQIPSGRAEPSPAEFSLQSDATLRE